eukprot:TRINITY_DN1189_c0_g1_i1.p1 TRINITY_DN1189_c0_g1~~TRINITY_DN1189_c0_g1_i1.p1  ORF type:complete len:490 (+),score=93.80 TRINITY_DN1189_c0_g1_i1:52-1521(+)
MSTSISNICFFVSLFLGLCISQFVVDVTQPTKPFPHFWEECVGSGHATLTLRADYQEQLQQINEDCGFKSVRFHGLLNDDMSTNLGPGQYSFFNIDSAFDFFVSIGMKPLIEISFMPEWLASKDTHTMHYKANTSPPKSYEAWYDLIYALTSHLVQRYGIAEVRTWRFECWNEPNLIGGFWTGTQADYFTLYNYTVTAIKKVDSQIPVGGPTSAGGAWITDLQNFCKEHQIAVDFIDTHNYPSGGNNHSIHRTIDPIFSWKKESGSKPLVISEYGSSWMYNDPFHDEYPCAAFVAGCIDGLQGGVVDVLSYWTFSDVFEEGGFPSDNVPFYGGFGLMNLYGVPKPAYRAFQIFHGLGTSVFSYTRDALFPTVHLIPVLSEDKKSLVIIAYNQHLDDGPTSDATFKVEIKGTKTTSTAYQQLIDANNVNPKKKWQDLGSPNYPSPAQVQQIMQASQLSKTAIPYVRLDAQTIQFTVALMARAFTAIEISL